MKEEIVCIDDVQDGSVLKWFGVDLTFKGKKQAHLSICTSYHTNPDFLEISEINFLEDRD